jgi:hypothetical protein
MNNLNAICPSSGCGPARELIEDKDTATTDPHCPLLSETLESMSFEEFLPRQIGELGMRGWISPEQAAAAIRDGDGSGVRIAVLDSGIVGRCQARAILN